ncbi:adenosylcobinamide amidohydrolase [Actinoplanes sp. SE50]|uniref:adenosylcobinamide amidohydrolase n=1 Tax=unclassified Actinoplanes TaxID=2626549 RepID=UPI00023ECD94|nr:MULTISPECIES: adenosylcobinamide amidohydrolase [unclassified Actinoplanes]AEV87743.1 Adenosylcobinamide amidohydrolase [Actinoplanes sp. SE50/110]ATO86145.1 adenosylcobinamide amidohydrolase [Actinoplanes sp. SE50]SLM03559.1 adenosylcobinamide amidohydrolase [Actinoplanes sp. SE50/110]
MLAEPSLTHRPEDGHSAPLLLWRFPEPVLAASTAVLGGGVGRCEWVINASVPMSYARPDPANHLAELAAALHLTGPGIGLLTGVDVHDMVATTEDGVEVCATVGLGAPIRAAEPGVTGFAHHPGTINIVIWIPQHLAPGALLNIVATATEAKTQALYALGLHATGTATDAIAVLCPAAGPTAAYGGPRSRWGAPMSRAVYEAVHTGGHTNLTTGRSWSSRAAGPPADRRP